MIDQNYICPCCGWPGLSGPAYANLQPPRLVRGLKPPYSAYFGMPSFDVCDCCGFEFGNDDEPGTAAPDSFETYLAKWIDDGEKWFNAAKKTEGWSLETQLSIAAAAGR